MPRIAILQINSSNGEMKMYNLDVAAGDEFENKVFLDNVVIGCGDKQLYMYDRSVVMGPIPFWNVTLLEVCEPFSFFFLLSQKIQKIRDFIFSLAIVDCGP